MKASSIVLLRSVLALAGLMVSASSAMAGLPEAVEERAALIGQPIAVSVHPPRIQLTGPPDLQQILVMGRYSDGSQRDLTPLSTWNAEPAGIVSVSPSGLVKPLKTGTATLTIQVGQQKTSIPVAIANFDNPRPTSFRHDFIAALNVAGCNQGACHGIPSGRGGFKLSLRGYNPPADYLELTHSALSRRTDRFDPDASLILKKGLGGVAHEGGPRLLSPNKIPAEAIRTWLAEGLKDDPATLPALKKVEVLPGSRVTLAPARWQQLAVLAHFADGTVRDVTRLTAFSCSDETTASVDPNGLVELKQRGEVAVLCRYCDIIECVRFTYLEPKADFAWTNPPKSNDIDRHIFDKLQTLNILPSELCTDEEFVRRVYLDLCGMLPKPEDVREFLADSTADKRTRLVDALLERPDYADFWAHKWLDVLRSNRLTIQIKGSHAYREWLRTHIDRNTPWNKVVQELLTASGSTFSNPPANYYRGPYNNGAAVVRDPQGLAESTAQLFLGIRLQCAQCHNHPFERWTQDDYHHMAAFFSRLKAKPDAEFPGLPPQNYPWQLRENSLVIFSGSSGEAVNPNSGKTMAPKVLGMPAAEIPTHTDRRLALAEQITSDKNPFFAKAIVNRLWYHMLGRGIVDPPDDFRDSNPSVNDPLLDGLAKEFIARNYDTKHIIRTIANSRTYQLSTQSNPSNQTDEKYFSHALVKRKRLTAEVLLDAICDATAQPEEFTGVPAGTRATQLPDGQVIYTGGRYASWDRHPFLKSFGQPAREAACECEREGDINLARALEVKNGDFLLGKVRAPKNRIGQLMERKAPDEEMVTQLFLATLSRRPVADETRTALAHVQQATDKRAAWENIHWALLNTNEFLFRH